MCTSGHLGHSKPSLSDTPAWISLRGAYAKYRFRSNNAWTEEFWPLIGCAITHWDPSPKSGLLRRSSEVLSILSTLQLSMADRLLSARAIPMYAHVLWPATIRC